MDYAEATTGNGRRVSYRAAAEELESHGVTVRPTPNLSAGIMVLEEWQDGSEWHRLPLNSAAILEWLGY